jgi:hypothetical protein
MIPAAIVSALRIPARVVGLGASVLGTLQFLFGALGADTVDRFADPADALAFVACAAAVVMAAALALAHRRARATMALAPTSPRPQEISA